MLSGEDYQAFQAFLCPAERGAHYFWHSVRSVPDLIAKLTGNVLVACVAIFRNSGQAEEGR